jgi:hypothetical protein
MHSSVARKSRSINRPRDIARNGMRHKHKEGRHNQMSVRLETVAAVERVADEQARSPTNVVRTVLADLACNCCSAPRALF